MKKQKQQIKVKIPKDIDGIYSNVAFMNFNNSEFILDFAKILPGIPEAKVNARIILSPQHCKRFMNLMKRNIDKFEERYGEIKNPEIKGTRRDVGFQSGNREIEE